MTTIAVVMSKVKLTRQRSQCRKHRCVTSVTMTTVMSSLATRHQLATTLGLGVGFMRRGSQYGAVVTVSAVWTRWAWRPLAALHWPFHCKQQQLTRILTNKLRYKLNYTTDACKAHSSSNQTKSEALIVARWQHW